MSVNEGERRFIQVSQASVELIADSAGYSDISKAVLSSLAEDSSYRVRELIQVTFKYFKNLFFHVKSTKLFDRAAFKSCATVKGPN